MAGILGHPTLKIVFQLGIVAITNRRIFAAVLFLGICCMNFHNSCTYKQSKFFLKYTHHRVYESNNK